MGFRVRIRLFHILHFVMHFLFPLLKNCKSGVDDRGHRLRSGSPVTNLPGATPTEDLMIENRIQSKSLNLWVRTSAAPSEQHGCINQPAYALNHSATLTL